MDCGFLIGCLLIPRCVYLAEVILLFFIRRLHLLDRFLYSLLATDLVSAFRSIAFRLKPAMLMAIKIETLLVSETTRQDHLVIYRGHVPTLMRG